jgi:DNA invertase Pin-like site-specific DNA recombinase
MPEQLIGYAHTASIPGSLEQQIEELRAAGCTNVFTDAGTAVSPLRRSGFTAALQVLNAGDKLIVCAPGRLSRNMSELANTIAQLNGKGIELVALDTPKDAVAPLGLDLAKLSHQLRPAVPRSPLRYAARRLGETLIRYSMGVRD